MSSFFPSTSSKRIKSFRLRGGRSGSGRSDHGDDDVPLDFNREPNDILKEILLNVCGFQNVSTSRKLGHLNNFVKLFCTLPDKSLIKIPTRVIMVCLKATLVSDVKEVRAAGVRAFRYLINDDDDKKLLMDLHIDYLITKCLDISHFNEVERIQAVRLIRKIAHLKRKKSDVPKEPIVPLSLMACVVSVSVGGAEERDRVYRTCLAVLCELALLQPWLVVRCNGILALINAILECHMYQRISECLCFSLMYIINHPLLRKWHESRVDVSPTFAPFTELNYRLHPDVDDSKLSEELEMRFMASKMAIVSLLRSWSGLLHICHSKDMIKSFVQALLIPNDAVRRGILSVLCELFYFNELHWTNDFKLALNAAAPGHFKDNWRIAEGFVVAEGKSLLPLCSVSRPDLVDCHLSILLSSFVKAGLLEALTQVALSKDSYSCVNATIVLGSTLHLVSRLLPADGDMLSWQSHLPHLLKHDTTNPSIEESLHINLTVKRLQEVLMLMGRPPKPYSLYLSQLVTETPYYHSSTTSSSTSNSSPRHRAETTSSIETSSGSAISILRRNRSLNLIREFSEDHTLTALKNTKVLTTKEYREWDWVSLQCLFVSPPSASFLRAVASDDTLRRFYRRLIYFYLPSSKLFSAIDLVKEGETDPNKKYVQTACHMVRFLSYSDDEGQRILRNLIVDIVASLPKVGGEATGYSKASGSLAVTCSREYFFILGTLSCHPKGDQILGHCKAYHYLMGLACEETHDSLIRLLVSSLHYSEDSPARIVLGKVLTTCSESARLYATGFLRVLLRSKRSGFQRWGTELLTTQLFDKSNEVASEALDILHEACNDREYLHAVVRLRPTLLHLGERGALLVCRFMSEPQGFIYWSNNNYLNRELKRWWDEYNERYVLHVEELLKLSLTTFERPNKEDGFVRRSGNRKTRQSVYLPAHLYGELCFHEAGASLIDKENIAPLLTESLKELISTDNKDYESDGDESKDNKNKHTLKIKSYLWALAHIGSTTYGLPMLERCDTLPLITKLAFNSPVPSIRGTCIYCLCTIAQTIPGVEALRKLGYQCMLTMVNTNNPEKENRRMSPPQPVVTPTMPRGSALNHSISTSSQWSTHSVSSNAPRSSVDGSMSNLSTSSESARSVGLKSDTSRSRASSRTTTSESKSSIRSKIGRREKKASLQDGFKQTASPSKTPLSSSNVSSRRSSVFEDTSYSVTSSNFHDTSTPSPSKMKSRSDRESISESNRFGGGKKGSHSFSGKPINSLETNSPVSTRLLQPAPKPKLKDRLIDLFMKKGRSSRSKSFSSGLVHTEKLPDDSSSGYVSDQLTSAEIPGILPSSPKSPLPIQLQPQMNVVLSSQKLYSDNYTSSNNSVDTIKGASSSSDIPTCQGAYSIADMNSDADVTDKDATLKADISSWNLNNNGQTSSMVANQDADGKSSQIPAFYIHNYDNLADSDRKEEDRLKILNNSGAKRTRSLPDILDPNDDSGKSTFYTLPSYNLKSYKANLRSAMTSKSVDEMSSNENKMYESHMLEAKRDFTSKSCTTASAETERCGCLEAKNLHSTSPASNVNDSDCNETSENRQNDSPECDDFRNFDDRGFSILQVRVRGNTLSSQDSGVGVETAAGYRSRSLSSPYKGSKFKDKQPLLSQLICPTDSSTEEQWHLTKPTGLAAVRLISQKSFDENKESPPEESPLQSKLISFEERDDIIKNTRYVGIAIPLHLNKLFAPPIKQAYRKTPFNFIDLMKETSVQGGDQLEVAENMRERKVSTARQAPKLRGLDEAMFGAAATAGIMQPRSGKMNLNTMTPYARTPESILSDASDICYIGGQVVEAGSEEYVVLVHEEIIQLVINLSSTVGIKVHETSLLMLKEKKPEVFDSISLYNSILGIMSEYSFRLTTRRFVQELFQDIRFSEVYQEAQLAYQTIK